MKRNKEEKMVQYQIKKTTKIDIEELKNLSKEELLQKIQSLHSQNIQLKQLLSKSLRDEDSVPSKKQKSFDFSKCVFRHILLKFYYLGWHYHGFTAQEDTNNTIEHHLFKALIKTCLIKDRNSSNYHRCGRTDKGVSSFGQTISITVRSKLSQENIHKIEEEIDYCKVLNRVLPHNIQCIAWCPLESDFSARFNCKSRTYKYFFPRGSLNIEKMRLASKYLEGVHDFRNLCKMDVGNGVVEFIRNIYEIKIEPLKANTEEHIRYNMYVTTIKSQAFLWHQIRCIMSLLFLVGEEKESPDIILELLNVEKNPRKPEYNMASEVPLNLYYCEYDIPEDNWCYNKDSLGICLNKLNSLWCFQSIKTCMIKMMLDDLNERASKKLNIEPSYCFSDYFIQGVKNKNYIPLLQRKKCESLENKIQNFVKRKKLKIVEEDKKES